MSSSSSSTVIIGCGIAGLYSAYQLWKQKKTFIILEKNSIGGRANNRSFYGSQVPIGAGVGRKHKDKLLIQLLHELEIPYKEKPGKPTFHQNHMSNNTWKTLQQKYSRKYGKNTFREFASEILGMEAYTEFVQSTGFYDYENASAYDTLHYYGMDDNIDPSWTALLIPWDLVVNRLCDIIGRSNIRTNTEVLSIRKKGDSLFQLQTSPRGVIYECNRVICAVTVSTIRKLFPTHSIYRDIMGQPFLRIYGKFTVASIPVLKQYIPSTTIVKGPLQKLIPINAEKGIYMIVYNDNRHSVRLSKYKENTPENRETLCLKLKKALSISESIHLIAIQSHYWKEGTHYYKPLDSSKHKSRQEFLEEAQHPQDGILVVGEMVSLHQGWVEGALESVLACKF